MSVDELKRINGLKGNLIRPGMVLKLKVDAVTSASAAKKKKKKKPAVSPPPNEEAAPPPFRQSLLPFPDGDLEEVALSFLSTPYLFGAENRNSTDCSGFTQQVFRQLGLKLPRTAREQFRLGEKVSAEGLQRGDLIFFRTYAQYPSHVGIYLQDGKMIHASRNKRKVIISNIDLPYFRNRYLGARRIACFDPVATLIGGVMEKVDENNEEGVLDSEKADTTTSPSDIPLTTTNTPG
jgi:cell wall-associated NlpC family hydrolase